MKVRVGGFEFEVNEAGVSWEGPGNTTQAVTALVERIAELEEEARHRSVAQGLPVRYLDASKRPKRVINMLTGEVGVVSGFSAPNLPWHEGGVPYVRDKRGEMGYWYFSEPIQ